MTITHPKAVLGVYDLTLNLVAASTGTAVHAQATVSTVASRTTRKTALGTFEPNFWLLRRDFYPSDPLAAGNNAGFISDTLSDASGIFATPPTLTITMAPASNSTPDLTVEFQFETGDYCTSVKVQYYDNSNVLLDEHTYSPTAPIFSTGRAQAGFKKIVLTFYSTNKPYRYVHVTEVDFGSSVTLDGATIKTLTNVEECKPYSTTLPYGTAELHVQSSAFNALDSSSLFPRLQSGQPADLYETVDGVEIFMGRYYLDTFESTVEAEASFTFVDALGVLDSISISPGLYIGTFGFQFDPAYNTLANILARMPISLFLPDSSVWENIVTEGPHSSGTARELLQRIAFINQATLTCARSKVLVGGYSRLASALTAFDFTLTLGDIGSQGKKLTLLPPIDGVELTLHRYKNDGIGTRTVFTESLAAGDYSVDISLSGKVYTGFAGSGYTVLSVDYGQKVLYFHVAAPGTVTITASNAYFDSKVIVSHYRAGYNASVSNRILRAEAAYGFNASVGGTAAEDALVLALFNYYSQQYLYHVRVFAPQFKPGDSVLADVNATQKIGGIVEHMENDLAGGFISEVDIVGVLV